ncbi:DUF6396 domain-containing protein [Conservatibacter flavescens]|uniref:DUF6396 domain-containing protein n=1 Tax=Conservatibacter flavescens TaxID=28161 RepID=UPI002698E0E1
MILSSLNDDETFTLRIELYKKLLHCASIQGFGQASAVLGSQYKFEEKYNEAVNSFHQGTKNGNALSARYLRDGFEKGIKPDNKNDYLALKPDEERVTRYNMIARYLADHDYLNPKVPELDEIVPLPPAKLPAWDGKIAFQRWYEGASPPKPSEELMQKLADQAGLDVNTGLPKK